jgi:hypothetical protein
LNCFYTNADQLFNRSSGVFHQVSFQNLPVDLYRINNLPKVAQVFIIAYKLSRLGILKQDSQSTMVTFGRGRRTLFLT